jgi:hypothetical protein
MLAVVEAAAGIPVIAADEWIAHVAAAECASGTTIFLHEGSSMI